MPYRKLAYLPDRRSTRINKSIPVTISGLDAARSPYHEEVSTLSISCHGCRYISRNPVTVGEMTILEVVAPLGAAAKCPTLARVRSAKMLTVNPASFDVAVELELPRNIWGVSSAPEDWAGFEQTGARSEAFPEPSVVTPFETQQVAEGRRALPEPVPSARLAAGRRLPALPPLVTHLVAALREPIKPTDAKLVKTAQASRTSRGSVDEICSHLESKASQILENLIAGLAKEITVRSEQTGQIWPLEAFERSVRGFEQAATTSARKSA